MFPSTLGEGKRLQKKISWEKMFSQLPDISEDHKKRKVKIILERRRNVGLCLKEEGKSQLVLSGGCQLRRETLEERCLRESSEKG